MLVLRTTKTLDWNKRFYNLIYASSKPLEVIILSFKLNCDSSQLSKCSHFFMWMSMALLEIHFMPTIKSQMTFSKLLRTLLWLRIRKLWLNSIEDYPNIVENCQWKLHDSWSEDRPLYMKGHSDLYFLFSKQHRTLEKQIFFSISLKIFRLSSSKFFCAKDCSRIWTDLSSVSLIASKNQSYVKLKYTTKQWRATKYYQPSNPPKKAW